MADGSGHSESMRLSLELMTFMSHNRRWNAVFQIYYFTGGWGGNPQDRIPRSFYEAI